MRRGETKMDHQPHPHLFYYHLNIITITFYFIFMLDFLPPQHALSSRFICTDLRRCKAGGRLTANSWCCAQERTGLASWGDVHCIFTKGTNERKLNI
jgi:hypothetical protein